MKPSDIASSLQLLAQIRKPAFVWVPPGVGKSQIVAQVAALLGIRLIDIHAVLLDPVDLRGLPTVEQGRAAWAIPAFLPEDGAGILFLDELNAAPPLVQAACYQLVLDRAPGEYRLPDGWNVRLSGSASGDGPAGRWTDAAEDQHGDLLDLIAAARNLDGIGAALDEARQFLGRPSTRRRVSRSVPLTGFAGQPHPHHQCPSGGMPAGEAAETAVSATMLSAAPVGSTDAARRLFRRSAPITGTLASTYLRARRIDLTADMAALRFHPRCWYRLAPDDPTDCRDAWPALIAAVTDLGGAVNGVHRTWLPSGRTKAPVAVPRRAMGWLLGHAVRFGAADDVMAAGEGRETVLSLRGFMPTLPLTAALSAAHLAGMLFPSRLRRLYIVRDNDPAGQRANATLTARAQAAGVEAMTLVPVLKDFNDDLLQRGAAALAASVRNQLAPQDVTRFWRAPEQGGRSAESAPAEARTLPSARLDPG